MFVAILTQSAVSIEKLLNQQQQNIYCLFREGLGYFCNIHQEIPYAFKQQLEKISVTISTIIKYGSLHHLMSPF